MLPRDNDDDDKSMEILQLPAGLKFTYHAEGAANILYKISLESNNDTTGSNDTDKTTDNNNEDDIPPSELPSYGPSTPPPTELESWEPEIPPAVTASFFNGKLLRLRKDRNQPSSSSSSSLICSSQSASPLHLHASFKTHIAPLFAASELVQSTPVALDSTLISSLNADLKACETRGVRPDGRCGVYLPQPAAECEGQGEGEGVVYGLLVDDVAAGLHPGGKGKRKVIELKPKWLLQSPDAPDTARRCRTCALRLMRKATAKPTPTPAPTPAPAAPAAHAPAATTQPAVPVPIPIPIPIKAFCPLALASRNERRVHAAIKAAIKSASTATSTPTPISDADATGMSTYLSAPGSVLQNLRTLQERLCAQARDRASVFGGGAGAERGGDVDMNFLILMTLRDCSLFLTLEPSSPEGGNSGGMRVTSARLGDLDLKDASRLDYWRDVETRLREGGWYDRALEGQGEGRCFLELQHLEQ